MSLSYEKTSRQVGQLDMADESMDVDAFDSEVVQGGGGYVDDDIDLDDDDDDDEPLLASGSRSGPQGSPLLSKGHKRRAKASSSSLLPELKKRKKDAAHPDDYHLRRAGTGSLKDYVVAKFITRVPDFSDDPHVRLYRHTEGTVRGREQGIENDRKEKIYFNSFSGKRRLERYEKQGIVTIPDRYKNGWTMEITPKHIMEEKKRRAEAEKADAEQKPANTANGVVDSSPAPIGVNVSEPEGDEKPRHDPDVDVFEGTFDGKATSRYAIMVMTEGTKTVDVIPLDNYGWCSFRAIRAQGAGIVEAPEAVMRKNTTKSQNRMARFFNKLEDAQFAREQGMGDNTRIANSKEYAGVGIRRNNAKYEDEVDKGEELDFEEEFEDDDVTQVDKETVKKSENRVLGDAEQNAKDFRKLIKDEPITSRPASPGSESEEEPAQGQGSRPTSRSPSPSRPSSVSRSPSRSMKSTPAVGSRQPTPMGTSPYRSTPLGISPSPGRSPRGNTPQKLDLSHLLPPSGTLPTSQHIKAVLSVLLKTRERIMFKEFLQYFETSTKEQKKNLTDLVKVVATLTREGADNRATVYMSWKRPQLPAGPSGR